MRIEAKACCFRRRGGSIRQSDSHQGAGRLSVEQRVFRQQNLAHVLTLDNPPPDWIPVENQHALPGVLDGVLIDLDLLTADGDRGRITCFQISQPEPGKQCLGECMLSPARCCA